MSRLPSPAALRTAAVAAVAGAGVALLGLSVANVAAIDAPLAAATHQARPPVLHTTQVSYVGRRDCPWHHRHAPATRTDAPAPDLEY